MGLVLHVEQRRQHLAQVLLHEFQLQGRVLRHGPEHQDADLQQVVLRSLSIRPCHKKRFTWFGLCFHGIFHVSYCLHVEIFMFSC